MAINSGSTILPNSKASLLASRKTFCAHQLRLLPSITEMKIGVQHGPSVDRYPRVTKPKRPCWSIYAVSNSLTPLSVPEDRSSWPGRNQLTVTCQLHDVAHPLLSKLPRFLRCRSDSAAEGTVSRCVSSPWSLKSLVSIFVQEAVALLEINFRDVLPNSLGVSR